MTKDSALIDYALRFLEVNMTEHDVQNIKNKGEFFEFKEEVPIAELDLKLSIHRVQSEQKAKDALVHKVPEMLKMIAMGIIADAYDTPSEPEMIINSARRTLNNLNITSI